MAWATLQENYGKMYMSTQIAVVMATHSDSSSPLCVTTQSPAQFANALSQGLVQDLVRRADRGEGRGGEGGGRGSVGERGESIKGEEQKGKGDGECWGCAREMRAVPC